MAEPVSESAWLIGGLMNTAVCGNLRECDRKEVVRCLARF